MSLPNERDHVELKYNKRKYDPPDGQLFCVEASRCQAHTGERNNRVSLQSRKWLHILLIWARVHTEMDKLQVNRVRICFCEGQFARVSLTSRLIKRQTHDGKVVLV